VIQATLALLYPAPQYLSNKDGHSVSSIILASKTLIMYLVYFALTYSTPDVTFMYLMGLMKRPLGQFESITLFGRQVASHLYSTETDSDESIDKQ
jgi:hypothetical protein